MDFKNVVFWVFLLFGINFYTQKKSVKPASIYTFSNLITSKNSYVSLNKKLNLKNFNFVFVDLNDLDLNLMSVPFTAIGKRPSELIYDDYKSYRDEYLLKGFLLANDPTRWNLQCPSPLSVQPTN